MKVRTQTSLLNTIWGGHSPLVGSILALLVFWSLSACGSREQEDLAADAPAPEKTTAPLGPTKTGNGDSNTQTPKSKNSLTHECSDDLRLVTQVSNNSGEKTVRTILMGEVAADCAEGKTPVLTFSTEQPVTLLPLMKCEISSGRPPQITCRGNSRDIVNNGVIAIPVLVESGSSYTDLRATITFE